MWGIPRALNKSGDPQLETCPEPNDIMLLAKAPDNCFISGPIVAMNQKKKKKFFNCLNSTNFAVFLHKYENSVTK